MKQKLPRPFGETYLREAASAGKGAGVRGEA
jgi:hypothetical protein